MTPYSNSVLGWLSLNDQKTIADLAKNLAPNSIIVEIGSLFGKSSVAWAENTDPSSIIYCIDIFAEKYIHNLPFSFKTLEKFKFPKKNTIYNCLDEFKKNTQMFKNIKLIKGRSPFEFDFENQILFNSIQDVDLLFLDAEHKNPNDWDNINYFLPKMKGGGIISGHDYTNTKYPDIKENVKRLEEIFSTSVKIHDNSSIWSISVTKK